MRDFFNPSHAKVPLNKGLPSKNVRDERFSKREVFPLHMKTILSDSEDVADHQPTRS